MELGRNFCCFEPVMGCNPMVTIYSNEMGERHNRAPSGPEWQGTVGEISHGTPLRFWWEAEGELCQLIAYRHAMDDTTAWSAWDIDDTEYPVDGGTFLPEVGSHTRYVQVLDDTGTRTLCYFRYNVEGRGGG